MKSLQDLKNFKLDVVGIGNAIVDVLVQIEEDFLRENSLQKGNMALIDELQAKKLYSRASAGLESSGGSAANTLACLAQLGSKVGFIGRVKNDQLGEIFTDDLRASGAIFNTPPVTAGPSTARCMIFVTPDAQRTMCTYLGASVFLEPSDLDLTLTENAKVLYLEGYLWDSPAAKRAFIAASETTKAAGGQVSLSLSDSFCVDRHRESFLDLVNNHIDILFANEEEVKALFNKASLKEALNELKSMCKIAAITSGAKGSIVIADGEIHEIKPYQVGSLIDTTGAGDIYAGAFLHEYTNGSDLYKCGQIASLCAGHIVTQLGSRSNQPLKEIINNRL